MRCVIAGGGTGGHLFPAMAVAEAFMEREMGNEVLFVGTEKGLEARILTKRRFPLRMIRVEPIKGKSFLKRLKVLLDIPRALREALIILKEFHPQVVLGVGGYASGPTLIAAYLLGIHRAIHEQNVIPGMTNRILKWFSQRIFISFEETKRFFPQRKTILTGNPIRKEFFISNSIVEKKEDRFNILIFGGSLGAHRINLAVIEALDILHGLRSKLRFFHQTGNDDFEHVSKAYKEKGFDAEVAPFFDDMATRYQMADLVICRSGASSVAEIGALGKAAILIPYPYAANNHQLMNAKMLVEMGGASMILDKELNGLSLSRAIIHLYEHPEERERMAEAVRKIGRPKAAEEIVEQCYALVEAQY